MRWSERWAAPLLAGAALLYLLPLALHPLGVAYPPNSQFTDLLVSHLPNADYARRSLWEHGQVPLWNAQLFGGQPFAADPLAGLFYPPGWLLLLPGLPLTLGFNTLLWLHLAWGGLGAYRLLRAEGLSAGPALLGGLAFAGAPKVVAHLGAGHVSLVFAVAWTPWLLSGVRQAALRGGLARGATAGAVMALVFLADVRWALYAGALGLVYAGWTFWTAATGAPAEKREAGQRRAKAVGGSATVRTETAIYQAAGRAALGFFVTAALLSAVLAVPLVEFVRLSSRTALTLEAAAVYSLPPVNLLGVLLRNPGGFHEHMTYAGTLTALLAVLGVGRRTLFWCAAVVGAAAFALGTNFVLFPLLFRLVPGLGLLRVPPRAWLVAALGLCVLAAHGAEALTVRLWPRLRQRYARLRVKLPSGATALAIMAVVGVLDLARFNATLLEVRSQPALSAAAQWLRAQPGPLRVYSPSYSLPAGDGLEHVDGVDPLQLAATVSFLEAATGVRATGYSVTLPAFEAGEPASANRDTVPDAALLGLLNTRYVAAEFPLTVADLTLVEQFGSTHLYANAAARPRAWLDGGRAEVEAWTPNRIVLAAEGPGRLVLGEVAYPGWRATVNGRPAPIVTEHGVLRAVDVPAGVHRVVFTFQPASVFIGAALSALGALGFGALLWRERAAR